MAEEKKKKSVEQLNEEQLNEVNGGESFTDSNTDEPKIANHPIFGLHDN